MRHPTGPGDVPAADLYRIAVEEYRFQATFNWSRTQYLLGLNAALFVAGTVVASRPGRSAALVFAFGILIAVLSAIVVRTQHGYYVATRAHLRRVEDDLAIPATQRLDTTATMGGRRRLVSVNRIVYLLLAALAVANTGGVLVVLAG